MDWSQLLIYTGNLPINVILWSIYIGVAIAVIASYVIKNRFGRFVSVLIEKEAFTPETALTLEETGLKNSITVKLGLKSHLNYKDLLVAITEDGKYYANYTYSDTPPEHKLLRAIMRQRKSKIKTKATDKVQAESPETNTDINTAETEKTENKSLNTDTSANADTNASPEINTANNAANNFVSGHTDSVNETAGENNVYLATDVNDIYEESGEDAEKEPKESGIGVSKEYKKERVKFRTEKARYYIPKEVHDKVKAIYNTGKSRLLWIIAGLIIFAVATYFAGFVIEGLMDMMENFGKN